MDDQKLKQFKNYMTGTKTLKEYLDEIEEEKKKKATPANLNVPGSSWGYVDTDDDSHSPWTTYIPTYNREYITINRDADESKPAEKKCQHKNTKMVQMIYTSFKLCTDCKEEVK